MLADTKRPYVDYEYYKSTFIGNCISENDFQKVEMEAESYISEITFDRVVSMETVPDEVKMAICSAADAMQEYLDDKEDKITSESIDGYSVSYATISTEEECLTLMQKRAERYLAGTGLLFRGWSRLDDYKRRHMGV